MTNEKITVIPYPNGRRGRRYQEGIGCDGQCQDCRRRCSGNATLDGHHHYCVEHALDAAGQRGDQRHAFVSLNATGNGTMPGAPRRGAQLTTDAYLVDGCGFVVRGRVFAVQDLIDVLAKGQSLLVDAEYGWCIVPRDLQRVLRSLGLDVPMPASVAKWHSPGWLPPLVDLISQETQPSHRHVGKRDHGLQNDASVLCQR